MLPSHLLYVVGSYLSYDTCHNLRMVNRYLKGVVNHEHFWKWQSCNSCISPSARFLAQHTSWKYVLDHQGCKLHLDDNDCALYRSRCLAWDKAGDLWIVFYRSAPIKLSSLDIHVKEIVTVQVDDEYDAVFLIFLSTANELRALFLISEPRKYQNLLIRTDVQCASADIIRNTLLLVTTDNRLLFRVVNSSSCRSGLLLDIFICTSLPENLFLDHIKEVELPLPEEVDLVRSVMIYCLAQHRAVYLLSESNVLYYYRSEWQVLEHDVCSIYGQSPQNQAMLIIRKNRVSCKRIELGLLVQELTLYPNFVSHGIPFAIVGDNIIEYLALLK